MASASSGPVDAAQAPVDVWDASAPIRICDIGGWTDTWFAGHGKVFNIGVSPRVEVQLKAFPVDAAEGRVVLSADNFGDRYAFEVGTIPGLHPLLEASVAEVGVPDHLAVEISVFSEAPAGSATGTSAAAAVALIGALDAMTPGRMTPSEIAAAAHRVEVEHLGLQSGVQDQLCAAFGGINFIEISTYPDASVSRIPTPDDVWGELDRRLLLVFLGRPHSSADIHDRVIADLGSRRADSLRCLDELRDAAQDARDAVSIADLPGLGRAMRRNAEAQKALHPDLVSPLAQTVIDLSAAHGALGWKVNGAGGEGGSLTLLVGAEPRATSELLEAARGSYPSLRIVPTSLSRSGLQVRHRRS